VFRRHARRPCAASWHAPPRTPRHTHRTTPPVPQDEPGGYKALVFDQGDRIGQSISAADVADICLRALHEPQARNKTFDVCYEFQSDEGLQLYELVASIPSTGSNYLASALSTLQKNT
jgi:hypothetical protein